jgi:hypothetical protein
VVSIPTFIFIGLVYVGFNLGSLLDGFLTTLRLGKSFIFLFFLFGLNLLCRSLCPGHVRKTRVGSALGTQSEQDVTIPIYFPFFSRLFFFLIT